MKKKKKSLEELRHHCQIFMALGDCACFGGVCAMRNTLDKEDVLKRGYIDTPSTYKGKIPVSPGVPALLDKVYPANQIVKVDCYVPGLPARAGGHQIWHLPNCWPAGCRTFPAT